MAEPIDKDTRGPVNLRIKFRSESLQQFIERYGVDVSRGGIFIRTREPLPVGTRLKLDFQLVDTAPLFQGDGTVVWIREHDASRAGVTPGMGVRFDRLTPESQTTLDTILEEKIRLQQSGVAPGSIAKAGAGIAVRRPSGAFATIDPAPGRPLGPPPLPVEVKLDTALGAAPVSPMPASSTRSGPLATSGSSSIFTRPRTTSGLRAVPVPSGLFEPPTADDIDKALSALEEKGGGPPALPVAPTVISRGESRPIGDDDPTRVFDGSVAQEFSASDAITGPATVLPEDGIPIETAAPGDGDLTQRRAVDPTSGDDVTSDGGGNGLSAMGHAPPPVPGAPGKQAPPLDAPLASLVDSGAAPAAKPAAPALTKPSASASAKSAQAVPMKITTDRPAATESGRFRSDARYKRKRGNGLVYALVILVVGGGVAGGGFYLKRQRDKKAAEAIAAAAAAPPLAAGQKIEVPPPPETAPSTAAPGTETAPGTGGAAASPPPANTGAAAPEAAVKAAAKPEESVAKTEAKPEKPSKAAEKATAATEKAGQPAPKSRRRDRSAPAPTEAAKQAEAAGDKKPAGDEAKPAADTAKTDPAKPAEAATKPAPGEKGEKDEKTAEAKPAEAAPAPPAAAPVLKITSSPAGADVVIDGVPVGTTPYTGKDITPDATHAISVKKDGYESHERMISGSDWSRGKGGVQSLKFNIKLRKAGGEQKPAEAGEKKETKPPEVEILTPSEP